MTRTTALAPNAATHAAKHPVESSVATTLPPTSNVTLYGDRSTSSIVNVARCTGGNVTRRSFGTARTIALASATTTTTITVSSSNPVVGRSEKSVSDGAITTASTNSPSAAIRFPTALNTPPAATAELKSTPIFWR